MVARFEDLKNKYLINVGSDLVIDDVISDTVTLNGKTATVGRWALLSDVGVLLSKTR